MRRPMLLLLLLPALCAAAEERRPLLVTVDDLPIGPLKLHATPAERAAVTRGLLAALDKHHIRAVGLVVGSHVQSPADEALLALWLEAGHELGNHSFRHPSYTDTAIDAYRADVEQARAWIDAFVTARGGRLRFFRFPYLREGDTPEKLAAMRDYLARSGQRSLPVTIDNQDWSFEQPWVAALRAGDRAAQEEVAADYLAALRIAVRTHERRGDRLFGRPVPQILMLHANAVGAAQWDALFTWLEASGHRFAGADEVLADPAFQEPHAYLGGGGVGLWDRLAVERRGREVRQQVETLLAEQAAAWNRGDLAAFCSVYAEDAAFASPSGLTHGRQAVLERYLKKYPDAASRGVLGLEVLETRLAAGDELSALGDVLPSRVHGVSALARWTLRRTAGDTTSGLTLLVLRPHGSSWQIVQDASM